MILRFNTKQQLIDALEARRKWAEQHDDRVARTHRKDEDAALTAFRAKCRELGKMNLVRLKDEFEASNRGGRKLSKLLDYGTVGVELPSCPESAVAVLDAALAALAVTRQERFTLQGERTDPIRRAHWLLTHDDTPRKRTVCA